MPLITLDEAKDHLRVTDCHEDDLITIYIGAAQDYIGKFLNDEDFPNAFSIKAAALLIVGDLYQNREASITGTIVSDNPTVQRLLYPYRQGIGI